jgi:UDP-N-acetylmuramoyl-tripeptide--D-alanyl-D-alanine ligase
MDIEVLYNRFLECTCVCTDTRKIEKDSLFFALKGPNFNANELAHKALEAGAKYAIIDDEQFLYDSGCILVKDVLTSMQQLANHHRRQLNIPVIAVTGSNGKTTTKELIYTVLSKKYKTHATLGNLNNHIGVPLTLLAIKKGVEIAIVEMGANHQKEITSYCLIAEPTHGIITNIGKAHLEGFGGLEGVKKGKGELYDYLLAHEGRVFINSTNEILLNLSQFLNPVYYPGPHDYYCCELLEEFPYIRIKTENGDVFSTHLIGKYNFENIAAALCIGKFFDVPAGAANAAVAAYDPQNNRSQIVKKDSNTIILDAYNANPSSMKAAIENFAMMDSGNKVLILGDMFELGNESEKEHAALGKILKDKNPGLLILCGKEMIAAKTLVPEALHFDSRALLEEWLRTHKFNHSTILIKGSRGMGLEKVKDLL